MPYTEKKRHRYLSLHACAEEGHGRAEPGRGPWPSTAPGLPASRAVGRKRLLSKLPRLWSFVKAAWTKTKSLQSFTIEHGVSCGFYGLYHVEVVSFHSNLVECFYYERGLSFVKCFFCIDWDDHVFLLSFILLMWCFTFIDFCMLNLASRPKSHLVMVYNSFNMLPNWVCWYFVGNFCINIHKRYLSNFLYL